MKNLLVFMLVAFTTLSFGQKKQDREKLTAEQQVELQLKKMTLDLKLNEKQQKDLKPILLKQAQVREETTAAFKEKKEKAEKMTADQRFEMKNKMLDNQIEMKAQMEKILSSEQMKLWEASNEKKMDRMKAMRNHKKEKRKGDNN